MPLLCFISNFQFLPNLEIWCFRFNSVESPIYFYRISDLFYVIVTEFRRILSRISTGKESLDVLESWVLELFSDITLGRPVPTKASSGSPIWKCWHDIYRLEAVKDVNILDLSWKLPCLQKEYKKKPEDYLAHLIGHGPIHLTDSGLEKIVEEQSHDDYATDLAVRNCMAGNC
ncbi:hypothetical protein V2J09_019014 [Rumex salicifolius]